MAKGVYRAAVPLLFVGVLAAVILSPLLFIITEPWLSPDWGHLSEIGQSYGAASALLAGIAFCALAVSIRIQTKQTRVSQLQAARSMQFDLIKMAIQDPDYRAVLGNDLLHLGERRWKEHTYLNLWIMYLQMAYLTGAYDEDGIRRALREEFFNGQPGLDYWPVARGAFRAEAMTKEHSRFYNLVEEAYAASSAKEVMFRSNGALSGNSSAVPTDPPDASARSQLVNLGIAALVVAVLAKHAAGRR
jgi:hypothetical protein